MNTNLLFDFVVDKDQKTITVKRAFAAPLNLVWDAWTKPEILDQWWAPKPYKTKTKTMDFREGGFWLYCMFNPENETHWCRADYKKIEPQKFFSGLDAFCDEDGNVNNAFPNSLWNNTFNSKGETTVVNIVIEYQKLEDLEKVVEMGFKEGFTMAMNNLDELFEKKLIK
jgi:uncharacterized protein YndB with AHSA1/START domain